MNRHVPIILVLAIFLVGLLVTPTLAQVRIDSTFAFQTDPAKKYALYVPTDYSDDTPSSVLIAFHPWNQNWGGSANWCDIMTNVAEANNLLMACPDGGTDGQVDDSIDKDFTSALLDSLSTWYTVDSNNVFVLGFSWGGRSAYTWGLDNNDKIAGIITHGVFMDGGIAPVTTKQLSKSVDMPFYILHGSADNTSPPATSFNPIRDALIDSNAIVNSRLLPGVGHTPIFADSDSIFTEAYSWVRQSSDSLAALSTTIDELDGPAHNNLVVEPPYPNPSSGSMTFKYQSSVGSGSLSRPFSKTQLDIFDVLGRNIRLMVGSNSDAGAGTITWDGRDNFGARVPSGCYIYRITDGVGLSSGILIRIEG